MTDIIDTLEAQRIKAGLPPAAPVAPLQASPALVQPETSLSVTTQPEPATNTNNTPSEPERVTCILSSFNLQFPKSKLRERSRLLPLTGRSVLDIHHIAAHIFAIPNNAPALDFDYIRFKGDYYRQHQNPLRIVAITEQTKTAFKALEKAEKYSISETALFFPAIDLSGGVGFYELVFLGIPYYPDNPPPNEFIARQQMHAKSLYNSLLEIFDNYKKDAFVSVMIEPCIIDEQKTMKFETPQERLDKISPLPSEKYFPPLEIAEKLLKQLPRKNDEEELTAMIRNRLLLCEQVGDPAWLRMVMNDVI